MNNSDKLSVPTGALKIIGKLNLAGLEAYAVGGCVRDSIIGKVPHDWDITTAARPEEIKRIFSDVQTMDIGIKYGTVCVIEDDNVYEVTVFRNEGKYKDFRHPSEVTFSSSLREDLARRDFTMNAVAYHPVIGITDPFCGESDIRKKVIRCVGNPFERLKEDPLRILRALRFSMQLDFKIESKTKAAMKSLSSLLKHISAERIRTELEKLLSAEFFSAHLLNEYKDVISSCIPFIAEEKLCPKLVEQYKGNDINIIWALLLSQQSSYRRICDELKFSNLQKRNICELIEQVNNSFDDDADVRHLINNVGVKQSYRIATMQEILFGNADDFRKKLEKIVSENQCCSMAQMSVNGKILMENGFKNGREVGAMLNQLLAEVLDGRLPNDKNALLRFAKSHKMTKRKLMENNMIE